MQELKIKATKRDVLGKKTRFLRRQGITPAHLFGHSLESLALQCDSNELKKIVAHAGTTRLVSLNVEGEKESKNVFLREIQKDALTRELLHVDFYQIRKGEKMTMDVPIVLVGEAPALKGKGRILSRGTTVLSLECLPEKVPPQIEVDISILTELEQSIHIKDIHLDPDILVHDDPELLVVKVSEVIIKVEEEKPVVEEVAEGEAVAEGEEAAAAEGAAEKPAAEAGADKKAPEKKAPEKKV
ncbi:MAG: 50S ribosomal protein L25 [Dehalococcoidales bacterium]